MARTLVEGLRSHEQFKARLAEAEAELKLEERVVSHVRGNEVTTRIDASGRPPSGWRDNP